MNIRDKLYNAEFTLRLIRTLLDRVRPDDQLALRIIDLYFEVKSRVDGEKDDR
jgi:hypothetical protein